MLRWILAVVLVATAICRGDGPEFSQAIAAREFAFPKDHGRHESFKTEWWYFTGNLQDETGRQFGYQLTFFRTAFAPGATTRPSAWGGKDLYFAHAAISDVKGQHFVFADRLSRAREGLAMAAESKMDVVLKDWTCVQDEQGVVKLAATEQGKDGGNFQMDLKLEKGRGPILQGPGGVNPKGKNVGQASYYYSMTRLPTSGTLTVNGQAFKVNGLSWMDHEFSSNPLAVNQSGWDWVALTLNDGTDLMIYRLRNKEGGTDYLSGTRVGVDGKSTLLKAEEITLTPVGSWKSAASGGIYPAEWKLRVSGSGEYRLRPLIANQELRTPGSTNVTYYEGAVEVTDEKGLAGRGYLEMTGYAKSLSGSF